MYAGLRRWYIAPGYITYLSRVPKTDRKRNMFLFRGPWTEMSILFIDLGSHWIDSSKYTSATFGCVHLGRGFHQPYFLAEHLLCSLDILILTSAWNHIIFCQHRQGQRKYHCQAPDFNFYRQYSFAPYQLRTRDQSHCFQRFSSPSLTETLALLLDPTDNKVGRGKLRLAHMLCSTW
jgi:hypothetical protein